MPLRALWTLPDLVGPSAGLRSRRLDFFHTEMKLNHLVMEEASGLVPLGAVNTMY